MKPAHTFSSLLALVSLVVGLPGLQPKDLNTRALRLPLERRNNQVSMEGLRMQLEQVPAKYHRGFAAYEANTGHAHPLSKNAGSKKKRDDGNDPLTAEGANLWYASIDVGSPAQAFTVIIDTGSSDIVLPSVECGVSCDGHNKYDPSTSSTAVDLGKPFVLAYLTGNVEGEQFADNVAIGGYTAVGQTLGAATIYSPTFSSTTFKPDGLAGFAFEDISVYQASPLFQTLVQSGQLPEAVFGVKLSTTAGASELYVGGTNTTLYQQNTLTYIPVTVPAYWQITLDQVSRAGVQVGTSEAVSIIDTGTSLIVTDTATAASYYNDIPGAILQESSEGLYSIPCDIIENYAPTLTFGGRPFNVSGETFNLGPIEDGSSDCLAGIGASSGIEGWLVGDVFLQNVYSVFDTDQLRVGFAELA
ncbi:hypothetical protein AZE42_06013 [Rhizopogon vesiculosus]|uniref:Peptidase A1 domain-containing protein n=1 Tax=Rhizopogon vesiculosus TaxID=180088 RepID=A0A1J8QGM0_9AGAM|nr:hypothetical protein AZE42_06013 [Rhizopogon vesiculosus]